VVVVQSIVYLCAKDVDCDCEKTGNNDTKMQSVAYLFYVVRKRLIELRDGGFGHSETPSSVSLFSLVFLTRTSEARECPYVILLSFGL